MQFKTSTPEYEIAFHGLFGPFVVVLCLPILYSDVEIC